MKRAQELVEFALVLPFLVFLVLGGLAVANAITANAQLSQAASRSALDATTGNITSCADAFGAAQVAVQTVVTSGLVTVNTITVDCDAKTSSSHAICTGGPTGSPSCTSGDFASGQLLTVKIDAQVDVSAFAFGPNLGISATGASIIPIDLTI
jgi:Flp pilus assembly protein TadG